MAVSVEREIEKALKKFADTHEESAIEWLENNVIVPQVVNSPYPGKLNLDRTPYLKEFIKVLEFRWVEMFTLCKSARTGGTLLSILECVKKIARNPGPVLWVDPTKDLALRVAQQEILPFIEACKPVYKKAYRDRERWKTTEMMFKDCTFGIIGAQSAAALGGRQAELLILNERDKFKQSLKDEAPPAQLAIDRTKQFVGTRKIIQNSTPTTSDGDVWRDFLAGTQHYIYLPCPECNKYQRLTFWNEEKEVPFDEELNPLPEGQSRTERTGRFYFEHCKNEDGNSFDLEKVFNDTKYECGYCKHLITYTDINWMNKRCKSAPHNPEAKKARKGSGHIWAAYSPFEPWGVIACNFLQARGHDGKMQNFYNSDLGKPFIREAASIKESDIDAVIASSPEYVAGQLPKKPEFITMTVDVQGTCFWWTIRAWGYFEDMDEFTVWSANIDHGQAFSWDEIREIGGLKERSLDGKRNSYIFQGEEYYVELGLVDSGYNAQKERNVYGFCYESMGIFHPSKGSHKGSMRGMWIREVEVANENYPINLLMYDDNIFRQMLYYNVIKDRDHIWWAPKNISDDWRGQLMSEYTVKEKKKDGTYDLVWKVHDPPGNHLGDCEKMQLVLFEHVLRNQLWNLYDKTKLNKTDS